MSNAQPTDTHQKALSINLDPTIFGSFAEIGAGQEVARWFLQVGGASGTVAKTISAYDKVVSDDLYGAGTRYVSMPRLRAMLEREWQQLLAQLAASRGTTTKFFAFVDTVSARNFSGSNECHGWIGLRFQTDPQAPPNDVVLQRHVQLVADVLGLRHRFDDVMGEVLRVRRGEPDPLQAIDRPAGPQQFGTASGSGNSGCEFDLRRVPQSFTQRRISLGNSCATFLEARGT